MDEKKKRVIMGDHTCILNSTKIKFITVLVFGKRCQRDAGHWQYTELGIHWCRIFGGDIAPLIVWARDQLTNALVLLKKGVGQIIYWPCGEET